MSNPTFLEAITESQQAAALLQSALQQANKRADAVGSLLVLPMLVEAVKLADQLRALESALAQSVPVYEAPDSEAQSLVAGFGPNNTPF